MKKLALLTAFLLLIITSSGVASATDLKITDNNLNTLDSFTYSGAWYNVGMNTYVLNWYGGGEYFEEPCKDPALYCGIVTATIMADYVGNYWGQCVSMVKNLAHNTVACDDWYRGAKVINGGISPGTPIARFKWDSTEQKYKYFSDYTCHAAIFWEYTYDQYGNINGTMVWDQNWDDNELEQGIVMMHKISKTDEGDINNANAYYVIQT